MKIDLENSGQDAFLDIVANLVGILIILVVVVGAQAAVVWNQSSDDSDSVVEQLSQLRQQTERKQNESKNLQLENAELKQMVAEEQAINARLAEVRHRGLVRLESVRKLVTQRTEELSEKESAAAEASARIDQLKQEIERVRYVTAAVEQQQQPAAKIIEHFPTPIAKTVFSDEIHFRLLGNRIVHVPLEELISAMKQQWELESKQLGSGQSASGQTPPIDNFRLQYFLESQMHPQTGRQVVQLQRFVIQPTINKPGELVSVAIVDGSEMQQRLATMPPQKTTVSLWVYPDSYEALNQLRSWLRTAGYQTASWPLEFGRPISGGPNGFRTSAN